LKIKINPIRISSLPYPIQSPNHFILSYLASFLIVVLITAFGLLIRNWINPTNLVMPYLLGVVSIAIAFGRGPAVFASVLGVIAFDIFLVPPYLTLVVDDTEYIITFLALFLVGAVISNLTYRVKEQVIQAKERETRVISLYNLSHDLTGAYSIEDVVHAILDNISSTLKHDLWLFLVGENKGDTDQRNFTIKATPGAADRIVDEAILSTYASGESSGPGMKSHSSSQTINLPLSTNTGCVGVISIAVEGEEGKITPEKRQLLEAYANLSALALERITLNKQASQAQLLKEKELVQSALLNSISHDFRTPLATITGTLSTLHTEINLLDKETQHTLTRNAWNEAEKLNRLVSNLLNMSRLESGALSLQLEPVDVQDLIGATLEQMKNRVTHPINIVLPNELPLIDADFVLIEQAMMNLLDNAIKYSPEDASIEICVYLSDGWLYTDIKDCGPGIPTHELPHIFEKFYRAKQPVNPGGIGLGLAIAKGILDAHQATLSAIPRDTGGMIFRIGFPCMRIPSQEPEK
jgi:two-component system sensor histidine kinase KdpD